MSSSKDLQRNETWWRTDWIFFFFLKVWGDHVMGLRLVVNRESLNSETVPSRFHSNGKKLTAIKLLLCKPTKLSWKVAVPLLPNSLHCTAQHTAHNFTLCAHQKWIEEQSSSISSNAQCQSWRPKSSNLKRKITFDGHVKMTPIQ